MEIFKELVVVQPGLKINANNIAIPGLNVKLLEG